METVRSGEYVCQLGLYTDPDLSPANLGEAFDYYSAIPGWGWRAIIYASHGRWRASTPAFGAGYGAVDYTPPEPEDGPESYFPCGRVVTLREGGFALEGGICLPPQVQLGPGDEFSLWVQVTDEEGSYGAELHCRLRENESWDALEPEVVSCQAGVQRRRQHQWSPADESGHRVERLQYVEPERPGLPGQLAPQTEESLALAHAEAASLGCAEIGSDHLLLALLREGSGQAARALAQVGVDLRAARAAAEFLNPVAPGHHSTKVDLSLSARKALDLARDEARRLGESKVDTLHLLLGLLRQKGEAVEILDWLGVSLPRLRHLLTRPGETSVGR
jgi:hypothetical protein